MRAAAGILTVLVLGMIIHVPVVTDASTILSDNLSNTPAPLYIYLSNPNWAAALFATDSQSYTLDSVTLSLFHVTGSSLEVDLYQGAYYPAVFIDTLTLQGSIPDDHAPPNPTFIGNSITLGPGTNYWVVVHALSGLYDWVWTNDRTGTGVGFTGAWDFSDDAGYHWVAMTGPTPLIEVEATPVPAPPALWLLGFGLLRLMGYGRFRKG